MGCTVLIAFAQQWAAILKTVQMRKYNWFLQTLMQLTSGHQELPLVQYNEHTFLPSACSLQWVTAAAQYPRQRFLSNILCVFLLLERPMIVSQSDFLHLCCFLEASLLLGEVVHILAKIMKYNFSLSVFNDSNRPASPLLFRTHMELPILRVIRVTLTYWVLAGLCRKGLLFFVFHSSWNNL